MFAWHKSLGSNFFFFGVFSGCINVNHVIRQHCLSDRDDHWVCTVQFLRELLFLRDNVGRYGCLTVLNRSEISCIVSYLATGNCFIDFIAFFLLLFVLYYVYGVIIK